MNPRNRQPKYPVRDNQAPNTRRSDNLEYHLEFQPTPPGMGFHVYISLQLEIPTSSAIPREARGRDLASADQSPALLSFINRH